MTVETNPAISISSPAAAPSGAGRLLVLLALFVGSGCAALIYEIVWLQMLQLVVGSTAVSLAVLLGAFMGGMCLGSLSLPRLIGHRHHPLRVYAAVELGIGLIGLATLFVMPQIARVYTSIVGHGMPGILLRGLVATICLLPPTVLMGASLPAIARWVETTPKGVSWLGFFYGGNIAGAVLGCLAAGFYLLRVHDITTAICVAAVVNAAVAAIAFLLSFSSPYGAKKAAAHTGGSVARAPHAWAVYVAIMLSGLTALGCEVVWTRLLSLLLGATVYTFSIILAVFLLGLGIGSAAGSFLSRTLGSPRTALGICQLLLCAAIAWSAWMLSASLPYWPIDPSLSNNPLIYLQVDLTRCLLAMLPAALLWGASFPLALAAVAARGQDPGRLVGGVYAANTVGAIFGAVGASLLLIPLLGSRNAQMVLVLIAAISALLVLAPLVLQPMRAMATGAPSWRLTKATGLVAGLILAVYLSQHIARVPPLLIAYGRYMVTWIGQTDVIYAEEGMNSSVAVTERPSGERCFHVSGKVEASSDPQDMRLQRMLGHLSALLCDEPRSVLVVGCGAGVTAGSFITYPEVERLVLCEIEPLIPRLAGEYFARENHHVMDNPRLVKVFDDGRHYLLTTDETFDVITSDPIHPWVKGSATLYTREYFEMVKARLNPGGVVTQWVPLYESTEETVKSQVATFFEVFPNGTMWSNDDAGRGYDVVLLARNEPMTIDVGQVTERIRLLPDAQDSIREAGFDPPISLLATYAGSARDLQPWLQGAQINHDSDLRLQYMAGLGLNYYRSEDIYDDIRAYRTYDENLFAPSLESQLLWEIIDGY